MVCSLPFRGVGDFAFICLRPHLYFFQVLVGVFSVAGGRSSRLRDSLAICWLPLSGPLLLDGMGVRFAGWISWDHLCCCDPLELPVYLIVSLRASLRLSGYKRELLYRWRSASLVFVVLGRFFGATRTGEFRLDYRDVCCLAIYCPVNSQAFSITTKKCLLPASLPPLV